MATVSQHEWHRKPAGWPGAPCPVCGCPTKRLRALHRATTFAEQKGGGPLWVKKVKVCFGLDTSVEGLR